MRVGVEPAIDQNHVQHGVRPDAGQLLRIDTPRPQPFGVDGRHPVQIVLNQNPVGGVIPMDGRDDHVAIAREVGGEPVGVAALDGEIQLVQHGFGQLGDQGARAVSGDLGAGLFGLSRQFGDQAQVGLDAGAHAGAADFQHHLGPVQKGGAMDLGDGGGGQGRHVKTAEDLFGRPAQRRLDVRAQNIEVQGGPAALQPFEFLDPVGRQQVRAGRQNLAQLDEGRTQRLQRQPRAA